ncbi:hypothetical protein [Xenorhabdus sp. SGI246]|uniref:hypothetical protein n=1 Tax=Xenorhabdus sp. SGI246 TaxID=3158263 RepID=UPI00349FA361
MSTQDKKNDSEMTVATGSIQSISGYWDVGSTIYIPADLRGKIITIIRGSGLTAPQQAIAVSLINGTSEQKLTGSAWIWLKFNFSSDSTTIEVAVGSQADFTQLFSLLQKSRSQYFQDFFNI